MFMHANRHSIPQALSQQAALHKYVWGHGLRACQEEWADSSITPITCTVRSAQHTQKPCAKAFVHRVL